MQEMQHLRNRFYERFGVPGVIGVIDCTHVAIIRPPNIDPLHIYVNRKTYHTINVQLDEENHCFLLGDSGYPLCPPLEEPPIPDTPADHFHRALLTTRCLIERCNGVLKNRWRSLLKHRTLHYTPTMAAKIINTCIILHNMCLHYNIPEPEYDEEVFNADFGMHMVLEQLQENEGSDAGRVNPDLNAARILQKRIIRTHFQYKCS
ncbi:hypothetical protein NQ314_001527 [Rhamnusium bicolor]|uniref:DDE Tnp4 domain-containing protein n=1 Tax=Rhamnusium bicolor TaxID=1586634 RepID=A0AAV8ZRL1_9CUCU|nr:hypothetical protein NQ314_001527 [Rhamnusium bicolor]